MEEEKKDRKSEQDLIEILERYPTITIVEELLSDSYIIKEYTENMLNVKRVVDVFQGYNDSTNQLNPNLSHQIPSTHDYVYIEFTPNGPLFEGVEYDDMRGLMVIAKQGLEIMQTFKQIPLRDREKIQEKYWGRVYDANLLDDFPLSRGNCLENALEAIKKELGEE